LYRICASFFDEMLADNLALLPSGASPPLDDPQDSHIASLYGLSAYRMREVVFRTKVELDDSVWLAQGSRQAILTSQSTDSNIQGGRGRSDRTRILDRHKLCIWKTIQGRRNGHAGRADMGRKAGIKKHQSMSSLGNCGLEVQWVVSGRDAPLIVYSVTQLAAASQ
jgi:hypothetical protein